VFATSLLCLAAAAASEPSNGAAATHGVASISNAHRIPAVLDEDRVIRDENGRLDYIVELYPDTPSSYPSSLTRASHFDSYHKPQAVNVVTDMESFHSIQAHAMTSWSSVSFSAFLNDEQVQRISRDPRVAHIFLNQKLDFSFNSLSDAGATWTDQVSGSQVNSWGKVAISNPSPPTLSKGKVLVYVVDAGVGQHQELNTIEWVNPSYLSHTCGTRAGVRACTSTDWQYLVGCYPHATAVAGVIGAKGIVTQGINPNVQIISVAVSLYAPNTLCMPTGPTTQILKSALDWVANDITQNNAGGLTSVVNVSINWSPNDPNDKNGTYKAGVETDMQALGSPASGPGALVVQAAGNYYQDACAHAYARPGGAAVSATDGIMVVGALNTHGQPVVPLTTFPDPVTQTGNPPRPQNGPWGFWKDAAQFDYDFGSDYGGCVDTWAPGDGIYVPMANPTFRNVAGHYQVGNVPTPYADYGFGSGTSFAAPHIAGLASMLIEQQQLKTPAGIYGVEYTIRKLAYSLGSVDTCNGGCNPSLSILTPTTNLARPTAHPYGEFLLTVQSSPAAYSINGFNVESYYTQARLGITSYSPMTWSFNSTGKAPYGCTVTRGLLPAGAPVVTMVSNQKSGASVAPESWDPADNGSQIWAVGSTCFPYGMRVVN